jgi:uncharacterized membrane protein
MVDFGLYATYALIGVSVLLIVVFAITQIAKNPAGAKNAIIGIVAMVVLFIIAYVVADGSDAESFAGKNISEGTSKQVGTGLIAFYILAGAAILSILYSEVTRLFK